MATLVEPQLQYKESFLEGLREFHAEGVLLIYDYRRTSLDFSAFLEKLTRLQHPMPPQIPSSDYWLIEHNEFIGRLSFRPQLNDLFWKLGGHIGYQIRPSRRLRGYGKEILRLGLMLACQQGMEQVLVTCDETNLASQRVIEANGGMLENSVPVEGSTVRKLRYWLVCSTVCRDQDA